MRRRLGHQPADLRAEGDEGTSASAWRRPEGGLPEDRNKPGEARSEAGASREVWGGPRAGGGSPAIREACSLRPWWHAGKPPAPVPPCQTHPAASRRHGAPTRSRAAMSSATPTGRRLPTSTRESPRRGAAGEGAHLLRGSADRHQHRAAAGEGGAAVAWRPRYVFWAMISSDSRRISSTHSLQVNTVNRGRAALSMTLTWSCRLRQ